MFVINHDGKIIKLNDNDYKNNSTFIKKILSSQYNITNFQLIDNIKIVELNILSNI